MSRIDPTSSPSAQGRAVRPEAWIDFTSLPNGQARLPGPAPDVDDASNVVTVRATPGLPRVVVGKLVARPAADSAYASYFQVPLGADGTRVGCEFTVGANDGGVTAACIALWAGTFDPNAGQNPPASRAHVVLIPGSATWQYGLFDTANHFCLVASGTFVAPAYDGVASWRYEAHVDEGSGDALIWLPDSSVVTVTAAQVATAVAGTVGWNAGTTLRSLPGPVAMVEHYAASLALTHVAAFPKFTSFWGEREVSVPGSPTPTFLARAVAGGAGPWVAPTLINGWTNTGGQEQAGYRRLGSGLIELRGYLTGTAGVAFVLPVGARPPALLIRPAIGAAGSVATVTVETSGNVTLQTYGAGAGWLTCLIDTTS